MEEVGERKERSIKALGLLGSPVFYAAFSTYLAISVLAFASSYVFQVFFKGFVTLIFIALAHGLILTPILLSMIGPPSLYSSQEEKDAVEVEFISKYS